jgi:predicted nucleic acid-binding protein
MILLDTSILARLPDTASPDRPIVLAALSKILRNNEELVVVPQNIYEFWAAATRRPGAPSSGGQNGLGMSIERAAVWLRKIQNFCRVLPEVAEILPLWQNLVIPQRISGFRAHDLRLIAAMQAHGISRLLTLNVRHFTGFGVEILDPRAL